jgi:hypothetical protein
MPIKYQGNVSEEGVLKIINRKSFDADLMEFAGKGVIITIERKKSKRSDPQNKYYWSCVVPIVQQGLKDLGHKLSREDVHLFLRNRFLKEDLLSGDFADFVSDIQQFGAEILGIVIPNPNEQLEILNN